MTSLRTSIDRFEVAAQHFRAFPDAFLDKDVASRWVALFAAASAPKWRKIDPWVLWEESKRHSGARFVELSIPVESIKDDPSLCPTPDAEAVVIALGHSRPAAFVKEFSSLSPQDWPLEGVISLTPGKRAFVKNHDGDVLVCTR